MDVAAGSTALVVVPSQPVVPPADGAADTALGSILNIPLLHDSALDSLAYLDNEAELSASRPLVEALVAEEAAAGSRAPAAYRSMIPNPKPPVSALPASNLAVRSSDQVDLSRYENIPEAPSNGKGLEQWRETLTRVDAIVGHENMALVNTGLQERFAPSVWKLSIADLDVALARAKCTLQAVKKNIGRVNSRRKEDQTRAGMRLAKLQREYRSTVAKNAAISAEIARLTAERRRE